MTQDGKRIVRRVVAAWESVAATPEAEYVSVNDLTFAVMVDERSEDIAIDAPPVNQTMAVYTATLYDGTAWIGGPNRTVSFYHTGWPYIHIVCANHLDWEPSWVEDKKAFFCQKCGGECQVRTELYDHKRQYAFGSIGARMQHVPFALHAGKHRHVRLYNQLVPQLMTQPRDLVLPQIFITVQGKTMGHNDAWVREQVLGVIQERVLLKVQIAPVDAIYAWLVDAEGDAPSEGKPPIAIMYKFTDETSEAVALLPGFISDIGVHGNKVTPGRIVQSGQESWKTIGSYEEFAQLYSESAKAIVIQLKTDNTTNILEAGRHPIQSDIGADAIDVRLARTVSTDAYAWAQVGRWAGRVELPSLRGFQSEYDRPMMVPEIIAARYGRALVTRGRLTWDLETLPQRYEIEMERRLRNPADYDPSRASWSQNDRVVVGRAVKSKSLLSKPASVPYVAPHINALVESVAVVPAHPTGDQPFKRFFKTGVSDSAVPPLVSAVLP